MVWQFVGWALWGFALLFGSGAVLLRNSDPGVRMMFRTCGAIVLLGCVATAVFPVSKFHLIWDFPAAFIAPLLIVQARLYRLSRAVIADLWTPQMTPEEQDRIREHLERGEREVAVQQLAEIQERHRASLLAAGIDTSTIVPEVGRELQWTDIVRQVFRVLEFDRAGTTVGPGNRVKAASRLRPYGYLVVESPILNQSVRLPIVHRDDFLLAASVFDDERLTEVIKEQELLVTYVPKHKLPKGLAGTSHALHYVITPRGTLDRYYEIDDDVHMAKPAPEKLFGPLVWEGEIRVQVNADPQL